MTETAIRYADALYELARDEQCAGLILEQYGQVCRLLEENPDYIKVLSAVTLSKQERVEALDQAFAGSVHPYLLSCLKLMCERGTIRCACDSFTRYRKRYNEDNGILEAVAVTAVPLSDALRQSLLEKLRAVTGKQIDLQTRTDPTLLGGSRLDMDGRQLDGTVRSRLEGLRQSLTETVL